MMYIFQPIFILQAVYFLFCSFLAFYIPGNVFLYKQKLDKISTFVISVGAGMSLLGIQAMIFGYLHIRWMTYIYLTVMILLWIIQRRKIFSIVSRVRFGFSFKKYSLTLFLLGVGCFMQLATVWFTGIPTPKGDYYCCGDARDNILHIVLAKATTIAIPPIEPGMSGLVLKNYHYISSVIVGEMVRIFNLPVVATDYQFMTVFISILLGLAVIAIGRSIGFPLGLTNWILFFFYFGGDLVFLLKFITTHELSFDMSSLEDGSKFLANFPRAFAVDSLLISIASIFYFLKTKKWIFGIVFAILLGPVIGLKVYVGIFAIFGLLGITLYLFIKRNFSIIPYTLLSIAIAMFIYIPVSSGASGLFFTQFWLFENFVSQPSLGMIRLELARLIYLQHNNWLRVYSYELLYIGIYFFGIFGTKTIAFFQTKKSLKYFPLSLHVFLISGLIVSFIAGGFFQQGVGSSANSFNFIVTDIIIFSFYAGSICYALATSRIKLLTFPILGLIILLTVPRVIVETYKNVDRIINFKGVLIPKDQMHMFAYIAQNTNKNAVIHVDERGNFGFDREIGYDYLYTDRQIFLSGQVDELEGHGVDFKERQKLTELMHSDNRCQNAYILTNIDASYILSDVHPFFESSQSAQFLIEKNSFNGISLYEINKKGANEFLLNKTDSTNCSE